MGHDKLRKFAENETFRCLLQPDPRQVLDKTGGPEAGLRLHDHPVKGRWNETMFARDLPIVLELGCGKGEYTIDLSQRNPECNYIGVDIKGARLWKGAKQATLGNLPNVAFLRTRIEFIEAFFAPGEVSEIWLTFSDPQLKSENSRLTSPVFLERYRKFLRKGGIVRLKTDSRFLYTYTVEMLRANSIPTLACTDNLYGTSLEADTLLHDAAAIQTYYEQMWRQRGIDIKYLCFRLPQEGNLVESDVEIPLDDYRSYCRAKRSSKETGK